MSNYADQRDYHKMGAGRDFATSGITAASGSYVELTTAIGTRSTIVIYNNSSTGTCFIGASGVAEGDLLPIPTGQFIEVAVRDKDKNGGDVAMFGYAGAAGGSLDVRILEID